MRPAKLPFLGWLQLEDGKPSLAVLYQPEETARLPLWLFHRGLAMVFAIAFASAAVQIRGLAGSQGILPCEQVFAGLRATSDWRRYFLFPTFFWFWHDDRALSWACWLGVGASLFLFLNIAPCLCLLLVTLLYLSLATAGTEFFNFQWDALLIESGAVALLSTPCRLFPGFRYAEAPPKLGVWLLRWLLFRLFFLNGWVKLASGDPSWRDLSALSYHYLTQPIPTPPAWYLAQAPLWFHRMCTFWVLCTELAAPCLLWMGRRARLFGVLGCASLQLAMMVIGNYAFFNWLALVLCLPSVGEQWFPSACREALRSAPSERPSRLRLLAILPGGILLGTASLLATAHFLLGPQKTPSWIAVPLAWIEPWRVANGYGAFAVMTKERDEIELEGSSDGVNWKPYVFRWKPQALTKPPPWVAPHQPRLDWQMWFAALSRATDSPWFVRLLIRLLQGSPTVVRLFAENPFPQSPPLYVRAWIYRYSFTSWQERKTTGQWWKRELLGPYFPEIRLQNPPAPFALGTGVHGNIRPRAGAHVLAHGPDQPVVRPLLHDVSRPARDARDDKEGSKHGDRDSQKIIGERPVEIHVGIELFFPKHHLFNPLADWKKPLIRP
ncbi:membrane hypothetical protein [Candidatus Methylacidithermus pantelleriae]|uniref:Lipase maturation factor family protein n=1 Tax=Candidatus Methylacidithermus pantelleriae TaxID=2744239 RepID=A0A8J2BSE4_9BACT|nr:membrane hypothetical protein [Candidatus Methylacidithermus pantelleriae]